VLSSLFVLCKIEKLIHTQTHFSLTGLAWFSCVFAFRAMPTVFVYVYKLVKWAGDPFVHTSFVLNGTEFSFGFDGNMHHGVEGSHNLGNCINRYPCGETNRTVLETEKWSDEQKWGPYNPADNNCWHQTRKLCIFANVQFPAEVKANCDLLKTVEWLAAPACRIGETLRQAIKDPTPAKVLRVPGAAIEAPFQAIAILVGKPEVAKTPVGKNIKKEMQRVLRRGIRF
jgi:hypothetical protein